MELNQQVESVVLTLVALLQQLVQHDIPGHIDLQREELDDDSYTQLLEFLGDGGVTAMVEEFGLTHIRQTGFSGVWWIVQEDDAGSIIGEFLEINYCPDIMVMPVEEVKDGLDALRAHRFAEGLGRRKH